MTTHQQLHLSILAILCLASLTAFAGADPAQTISSAWPEPTFENKPWARWWWLGSAVDEKNLTINLEELSRSGFGGVEVTPLYGAIGYEDKYIPYLSPEWMKMFAFTVNEAKSLGMGVDMPTGTGWPFGGPEVSEADADAKLSLVDGKLVGKKSGFQVKRAAPGGEGLALNPYSPPAMSRYLAKFSEAFAKSGAPMPRTNFHDSFEYHADWSPEVSGEFRRLCGYDLDSQADALFGKGDKKTVSRVRADYRRTVAALHLHYIQTWTEWAHAHGSRTRNQAHGAPGNLLDLYAASDIPETETFGSTPFPIPGLKRDPELVREEVPSPLVARFASSAAHTQGKRLVSCETWTWLRENFNTSLSQMKPEADQMLIAGINHIFYHGVCYSPEGIEWPGWIFYAAVQANPRNTIWKHVPELNRYITRIQSILQSGEPDNDILLYWPFEDFIGRTGSKLLSQFGANRSFWINGTPFANVTEELLRQGDTFDYISDLQIEGLKVAGAKLQAPGGKYAAILVPACVTMPVETMSRLLALAKDGATVIFYGALPSDVPGFADFEKRREGLKALTSSLKFTAAADGVQTASVGSGKMLVGDSLPKLLDGLGVARESLAETGLQFIRRAQKDGTDYFIANLGDKAFDGWISPAKPFQSARILDPLTGNAGAATLKGNGGHPEVRLQLKPGQTAIVRTLKSEAAMKPFPVDAPDGSPLPLAGKWQVRFLEGGPSLPKPCTTDKLVSWTESGGPEAVAFAGTARYTLEFDWQPLPGAGDWMLELGDLCESADVSLNGKRVGSVWALPFEIRVGPFLVPGRNVLEIDVTNLAANRIRDLDRRGVVWKKFGNINVASIRYQALDTTNWKDRESGLLGPVRLVPLKSEAPL